MTDLSRAVSDLIDTIKSEGFSAGIVEDIADDWDVKPTLLARMFENKTGKAPENFQVSSVIDYAAIWDKRKPAGFDAWDNIRPKDREAAKAIIDRSLRDGSEKNWNFVYH